MGAAARLADDPDERRAPSLKRAVIIAGSIGVAADIVLASLANGLNQADRVIMPIASISMKDELGWTQMERGIVLSSFAYGYIFVQLPSGWVSSRVSPFGLLFAAVLAWSLSTILTATAARRSFGSLIACRVVMGVAEGFCLPAIFQLFATHVPVQSRSRAFAFMIGCGALGQLLGLLVCPMITPWDAMFQWFGAAGLLWACCYLVVIASKLCRTDHATRDIPLKAMDSEDEGLRGEGLRERARAEAADSDDASISQTSVSAASSDLGEEKPPEKPNEPCGALCARLCSCKPLLAICAAHFGQNWTNYTLSNWLPTYFKEVLGMETRALSLTSVPFLANAIAGMLAGHVADTLISRKLCTVLTVRRLATTVGLLGPAACHVLFAMTRSPSVAIGIVTLSFTLGALTSSGYMANHSDISESYAGLTFGISNTVATLPGVVAGPLTAWLIEYFRGAWAPVFLIAAAINVACALVYLALSKAHRVL
jgi:ACS family sodium-dependent inorganic phosphate cotransporter